jgi:hypothetical protein
VTSSTWSAIALLFSCSSPASPARDAGADDAASDASIAADAGGDAGTTTCAEDCRALEDMCHVAHCNEAAGACVVEDRSGGCDDGDPCTDGDSCLLGICAGFPVPGCCIPDCAGASCGSDGCEGSCGSCPDGTLCGGARACVPEEPSGDSCADATAIALPFHTTSSTTGLADDLALPDGTCAAFPIGDGGPDAVYRYHATRDEVLIVETTGLSFSAGVYAITSCDDVRHGCVAASIAPVDTKLLPMSVPVAADTDVFIVVDGDGAMSGTYTLDITACVPDCEGAECGTDGCGRLCERQCPVDREWHCASDRTCVCEGICDGRECGSDGCEGSCGTCAAGLACDASGRCVTAGRPGDTASTAIPIDTAAFTSSGDTRGYGNDATAWWACYATGDSYLGIDAPDVMYRLAPAAAATYYLELTGTDFLAAMYAVRDPSDILSCVAAGYEPFTLRTQLLVEASALRPLYVIVDGHSTGAGHYTLSSRTCASPADCPRASEGQYCSWPHAVTVPSASSGSVEGLDAYRVPAGACGATREAGASGRDTAFAFTAPSDGPLTVRVTSHGGHDAIVYVTTDCGDLASACVGLADAEGADGSEALTFTATAGTRYFAIVDSLGFITGSFDLELTM